MGFLGIMGNSFGCSASGERLVSAARDGDLQEAKALLEYNPRLARYSTFGVRNSPLHYSAAQGHHEVTGYLLLCNLISCSESIGQFLAFVGSHLNYYHITGCNHEFCTKCALYLCSTNSTSTVVPGPPGSIPCPLCRHTIVSFFKIPGMSLIRELPRTSLSLSLCATCPAVDGSDSTASMATQLCKPDFRCTRVPPLGSSSFRSLSCQRFPSMKLHSMLCMGLPETSPCLIRCCRSGSSLRRSASQRESSTRSCLFAFSPIVDTSNGS
ncbi:hypothetical protein BHE74_00054475 [Ensete ventricosum]|uniref:Uncharacterized protein n=1 Tax=Ensete ventricosum TaxID=4639 RepID=A0A444C518_ENSVE|nr:hypothetical protein GW17_00057734 [Ensete ventricosum]RWW40129.1 hypothetical protein BHE74_00054475 [Ensete ventricosum]RZR74624.1 hypothetical protein BHM03_00039598 [Ensete ventricosum]